MLKGEHNFCNRWIWKMFKSTNSLSSCNQRNHTTARHSGFERTCHHHPVIHLPGGHGARVVCSFVWRCGWFTGQILARRVRTACGGDAELVDVEKHHCKHQTAMVNGHRGFCKKWAKYWVFHQRFRDLIFVSSFLLRRFRIKYEVIVTFKVVQCDTFI